MSGTCRTSSGLSRKKWSRGPAAGGSSLDSAPAGPGASWAGRGLC